MCGICGILCRQATDATQAAVRKMTAALAHRGPDDEGSLASPHCALGMRRLSVIDLAGGHQPLSNEDGRVSLILNGEIYNFRELRRTLESKGYRFRTQSDTEAYFGRLTQARKFSQRAAASAH